MANSIRIPALAKVAANLEAMMEASRKFGDAALDLKDAQLALNSLLLGCHNALDSLAAIGGAANLEDMADAKTAVRMNALRDSLAARLPRISGGAPDDFEDYDEAIFDDEWPAYPDAEVDGHRWAPTFDGPTPDDVLEASSPTWEPSAADWNVMYAMSGAGISEQDHRLVHGCV